MSVRFRSASVAMNVAGTSTNSITVNKPNQTADGDLMIAITTGPVNTVTPPAGWTQLRITTGTLLQTNIYTRTAASEGASYVFGFSTSDTCGVSIGSFFGGRNVHAWGIVDTGVNNPAFGLPLDAARDCVGYTAFAWQDTATATMTWTQNNEQVDSASSNTGATRFRGISTATFGPPGRSDIVNIGDELPSALCTQSQPVAQGLYYMLLIDGEAPDTEQWDDTDGHFDVELKLDTNAVNSTGSITSLLAGDVSGQVATVTSSSVPSGLTSTHDGLDTTFWQIPSATGYLQYDFGVGVTKTVRRYRLQSPTADNDRDPMNWTLQGSNDGSNFDVLDTRTNETFALRSEMREFRVSAPGEYRYYRLNVTANSSNNVSAFLQIAEFRLSVIDVWENITTFCNHRDKIRITRGLQSTSGRSDFSRAYVVLNNTDGRFSLRNTTGPYYRALQRNNEMRISKAYGTPRLQLQGAVQLEGTDMCGDGIRTPIRSAIADSSDFEVRVDFEPDSWRDAQHIAGVSTAVGAPEPWVLRLLDDGRLQLDRTVSGGLEFSYTSTAAIPMGGRQTVRMTLDQDNGASGSSVAFYYSDSVSGSFTQIGATVTAATTAATQFAGGALCVGHVGSVAGRGIHGEVFHWQMRDGIAGTVISEIDFTAQANGSYAWTENSNAWVAINNAVVSNRRYRFHGEVASWPVTWDKTGTWITAAATGAGVQKRLERGNSELSAMRRYHTKGIISDPGAFERFATPFAYWPLEDEENAFVLASGLPEKGPMQIVGAPSWTGGNGDKFHESKTLIQVNGAKYGGKISGNPVGYADIRWMLYAPVVIANSTTVFDIYTTGTLAKIQVAHESANVWRVRGFDEDDSGVTIWDSGNINITTTGERMHMQLELTQDGAHVDMNLRAFSSGGENLGSELVFQFVNATMRRVHRINVNPETLLVDAYVGHIALYGLDSPPFAGSEMDAFRYETAGARIQRLCAEEEVEFRYAGALAETEFMGHQDVSDPFPLMSSCAVSDDGYLIDPLDAFGVEYRTNRSQFNQEPVLTVSYTGNELSGELLPVSDDAHIVNDFTASRGGAGSARAQRTDGALGVSPPPTGVGAYEDSQSYSLAHEGQCTDLASWHVHLGTIDEDRFPKIQLALENLRLAADPVLTEKILKIDVGERVDVTDMPDFRPVDDIRQIVIGYEEEFDQFQHGFSLNTLPERPYEIAQYDTDDRFAAHGAYVGQDIEEADTTATVVVADGPKWSTTADDFDIVINGEQITVTAVSNATPLTTSDTFNRANSATVLGSTDGGTVQAWTQTSGTWGINGNAAYTSVALAGSLASLAAAADFDELSVTIPVWASGDAWLVFRCDAGATNRLRFGGTVGTDAAAQLIVASAVTRTETADAAGNAFVLAAGDRLSVSAHGSVIQCYVNGKLALTFTETTFQTATRVGMQTGSIVPRFDSFVFETALDQQTFTMTRSVNGVTGYHRQSDAVELYRPPYRGL